MGGSRLDGKTVLAVRCRTETSVIIRKMAGGYLAKKGRDSDNGEWLQEAIVDVATKKVGVNPDYVRGGRIDWLAVQALPEGRFATEDELAREYDRQGTDAPTRKFTVTDECVDTLKGSLVPEISECFPLLKRSVTPGFACALAMRLYALSSEYFEAPEAAE